MSALRPPRLRTATSGAEDRSATWLELFYDLVFVVAVAALGHRLLVDHSLQGVVVFAALFVPLWWSWASYTFYADRYDTDDLGQRLLAVAQMVAIALMAASMSGGETDSTTAFAVWYLSARTVLLLMYLRAYRHVEATRNLVGGYLRGFTLGAIPWALSIWVPEPWRYVLWGLGLAIDFATPWILRRAQANAPLSPSHLPERFGLFTILVLGESIAAVNRWRCHRCRDRDGTLVAVLRQRRGVRRSPGEKQDKGLAPNGVDLCPSTAGDRIDRFRDRTRVSRRPRGSRSAVGRCRRNCGCSCFDECFAHRYRRRRCANGTYPDMDSRCECRRRSRDRLSFLRVDQQRHTRCARRRVFRSDRNRALHSGANATGSCHNLREQPPSCSSASNRAPSWLILPHRTRVSLCASR